MKVMVRNSSTLLGVSSLIAVYMSTVSALPTWSTRSIASETTCSPPYINIVGSDDVSYCSLPSTRNSEPTSQTLHRRIVTSPRGAVKKNGPQKSISPKSSPPKPPVLNLVSLAKSVSQKGHKASPWDVLRLAAEAAKARSKGANKPKVNAAVSRVRKTAKPSKPSGTKVRSKGRKPGNSKARKTPTAKKGPLSNGPPKVNNRKPGPPNWTRTAKKTVSKAAPKKQDCNKIASKTERQDCTVGQSWKGGHRISLFAVNVGEVNYASDGDDGGDSDSN